MSHYIPKIQYGSGPTEIVFDYPPTSRGGNDPDERTAVDHTNFSISGVRQTVVDRIEVTRKVVLDQVSETLKSALQTFFDNHAYLGKSFKYFDDQNSVSYVTYELKELKFQPKRVAPAGANAYLYQIPLTLRRVLGSTESTQVMSFTIANNQVAAASLTGLTLDYTAGVTYTFDAQLVRKTDSSERVWRGLLRATYKTSTSAWDITPVGSGDGDAHGVTFSMSGNQVQYISDNQAGTNYAGTLKILSYTIS